MARKETLIYDGDPASCFNLTFPVGLGGNNEKGDVILIQAMFNFIALGLGKVERLGIKSRSELPQLTGFLYSDTIFAITGFQYKWLHLLTASKSGWIFPADYGQTLSFLDAADRRPPMFLLHQFAQEAAARLNETDYTTAMISEFTELESFIKVK